MAYRSSNRVTTGYTLLQVSVWITALSAFVAAVGAFSALVMVYNETMILGDIALYSAFQLTCCMCCVSIVIQTLASLTSLAGFIVLFTARDFYTKEFKRTVTIGFVIGLIGSIIFLAGIITSPGTYVGGLIVYPVGRFLLVLGLFFVLRDQGHKSLTTVGFTVATVGLFTELVAEVSIVLTFFLRAGDVSSSAETLLKLMLFALGIGELLVATGFIVMGVSLIRASRYAASIEPNKDPEQAEMLQKQDQLKQIAETQIALSQQIKTLQEQNMALLGANPSTIPLALETGRFVLCGKCGGLASWDPYRRVYHCYPCKLDVVSNPLTPEGPGQVAKPGSDGVGGGVAANGPAPPRVEPAPSTKTCEKCGKTFTGIYLHCDDCRNSWH